MLHRALQDQLNQIGSDAQNPPDSRAWRELLVSISDAYTQWNHEREGLNALFRALDEVICVFDCDGRITRLNAALPCILDADEAAMRGRTVDTFITNDLLLCECKVLEIVSTPGGAAKWLQGDAQPLRADGRILCVDGSTCDVSCSLSRIVARGQTLGGMLTLHDISDRKAIEETVRQSEQRLMLHVQRTPLPAIELTPDGVITRWNHAAENLFGWSEHEAVGKAVFDLIVPDHLQIEARQTYEDNKQALNSESIHQNITRDGKLIMCEWYSTVLMNAENEVIGIAALAQNITERLQYEGKLRDAKNAAEQSSHAKTNFLANMSHEVRTPMAAILGFADMLAEPELSDQSQQEAVETIRRNGEHLLNVINDILDVAKIEENVVMIERVACQVRPLVDGVAALLRPRAQQSGLSLNVAVDETVPEAIVTDPTRLRQILTNLISNAVKFTEQGGVTVNVHMEDANDGPMLEVRVTDTGIGMTPEQLENVFEPFTQADSSTTRRYGGTGLGLPISRNFARMLGGNVVIESTPGRGSTSILTVAAPTAQTPEVGPADPQEPTARLRGRVLLAEDGPDNQRLIRVLLEASGAQVTIANNGREAMHRVQQSVTADTPFDLVLLDMQMPVMDGYAAARALRKLGCNTPIVALTANAMASDRDRCLQAGCDDYLAKPMQRNDLITICARYLVQSTPASESTAT